MGVGAPSHSQTSDLHHAPSIGLAEAFHSVQSVNDRTVWLEERLSVCERLLIVLEVDLLQEVGCVVGHHCVRFGVVQAVLYYWHTSSGLLVIYQNFSENGPP